MQQLLVSRLANGTGQFLNRAMNQSIGGSIGAELVIAHVKTRAIGCIFPDVLRKQNAPAEAGQVILHRLIVAGKTALCEHDEVVQKEMDEHLQHIETPHGVDLALVEYGQRFETAPGAQHVEENPFGVFIAVRKIDLRQDFQHGSLARFDNSDVVSGKQFAVPDCQYRPVVAQIISLVFEGKLLQVFEVRPHGDPSVLHVL